MNMMNKHSDEARCASGSVAALDESVFNNLQIYAQDLHFNVRGLQVRAHVSTDLWIRKATCEQGCMYRE